MNGVRENKELLTLAYKIRDFQINISKWLLSSKYTGISLSIPLLEDF